MYNPDYPTDASMGFAQHTYQNDAFNNSFYWNGYTPTFGAGGNQYDSRRNDGPINPVNPFNQFGQFGQPNNTNQCVPENQVQPFSSYPPSTPQLNGMVNYGDSRRNVVTNNNPWAPQPTTPPPTYPTTPSWNQPCEPQWNNYNPCNKIDMSTSALYQNAGFSSYDKKNAWDNYYTNPRQIQPPQVNWSSYQNNYQNNNNYQQYCNIPTYPITQNNTNWKDMAVSCWSEVGKL